MQQQQLMQAAGISETLAMVWLGPLTRAMSEFSIEQPEDQAMFIAQTGHESAGFSVLTENFNYTCHALAELFPQYITGQQAVLLGRSAEQPAQQQQIAELIYGNRLGNQSATEGWVYRGRGLIQITGRGNYSDCAGGLNLPLLSYPEMLVQPEPAARSAAWFYKTHGCLAYPGNIRKVTQIINGGSTGLADRQARFTMALQVFSGSHG
ncbi:MULTISPECIES: glycoside hydrolase family 19 protein [Tatumella]|uniref:Glycoside hydrolase family 19 protein n=1 Tax=Tatumella punctata TaxID=399969 RepID=A0ABW1VHE8_9GAMM|nr:MULTISPECIES: glycoside hydrolase family 19 protein [unclassified Tatumella]MBS0855433.1 glycoside hydrolase family 19 protein [Tatumella sp. JGM16]MBS0877195.1 glycoside hydrolase family 19 protein [Tatumella sp. JGM82]MBS0889436.1 glycoside hydrolase family 19 protein [Tatumella sp. JGM94]MBS0901592.1 glycoside hydrolase family 19 protein [Tatumella sp. JGM100]MBS0911667.1 glycoside hydrolase family 19 protein [Tatumella sp. JGM91]